jgi:hypothetical protein
MECLARGAHAPVIERRKAMEEVQRFKTQSLRAVEGSAEDRVFGDTWFVVVKQAAYDKLVEELAAMRKSRDLFEAQKRALEVLSLDYLRIPEKR